MFKDVSFFQFATATLLDIDNITETNSYCDLFANSSNPNYNKNISRVSSKERFAIWYIWILIWCQNLCKTGHTHQQWKESAIWPWFLLNHGFPPESYQAGPVLYTIMAKSLFSSGFSSGWARFCPLLSCSSFLSWVPLLYLGASPEPCQLSVHSTNEWTSVCFICM